MALGSITPHALLLLVGVGLAASAWHQEGAPTAQEVELWGGESEQITRLEFVAKDRQVVLTANQDDEGRFWHGSVHKDSRPQEAPRVASTGPGTPGTQDDPSPAGERRKAKGERNLEPTETEEVPVRSEHVQFVGVTEVDKLAAALVPLRAKRSLGTLEPERLVDFGFENTKRASLSVHFEGNVRELEVGQTAPGGKDTYVRLKNGQAFVVAGNLPAEFQSAESRLLQRALHSWSSQDVQKATLSSAAQRRQLVRLPKKQASWAHHSAPALRNETASNWMAQFEQLAILRYEKQPDAEPQRVVRVDFEGTSGEALGFVELAFIPPPGDSSKDASKPQFLARSELSRWWGSVVNTTAEQLQEDLSSVLDE